VRTGLAVPVAAVVFYFGIAVYAIVPFRKGRRAADRALLAHACSGARSSRGSASVLPSQDQGNTGAERQAYGSTIASPLGTVVAWHAG
jgi:hypothetical protein